MRFALIVDNVVENIIASEQKHWLEMMFPDRLVVEITAETGEAGVDFEFLNGKFKSPAPFSSWIFNETTWLWQAPKPYPTTGKAYSWNEGINDWELIEPYKPFDSWVLDDEKWAYVPPITYPDDGNDYYWNESKKKWILRAE